jgi:hypothetical protein
MAHLLLPAGKEGQQQNTSAVCTKKSNFGIYFWSLVTLETLLFFCMDMEVILHGEFNSEVVKNL